MSDATWHDRLKLIGEDYLRLAEDRLWLARRQADFWALQARIEQQQAKRLDWRKRGPSKTPSGTFAGVSEALSRAKTEAHNPAALLEQARELDEEHRHTPLVPDPRKV